MSVRERLARRLFGDIIDKAVTAAVTARVDDSRGWQQIGGDIGATDRPWGERFEDLTDVLEAWQKNFLVRRLVTLTRSYVVGRGITVSSAIGEVNQFAQAFWNHPKNQITRRLGPLCDELTRAGEVFPVLFTNHADGMSYARFPAVAVQVREIHTDPDDYETELEYGQTQGTTIDLKWWMGPGHKKAFGRLRGAPGGHLDPLMLHWAVNRPLGAIRGEGDLGPVLPWAKRYSEWLRDRVRLNRYRTRHGVMDIELSDDSLVQEKRAQLATSNPLEHGIYVHGAGEKVDLKALEIGASEAADDGLALRLAIAAGANVALHYLGEGGSVNYATAKEMGEPTALFYTQRQGDLCHYLTDLVATAYKRAAALGHATMPADGNLQLSAATFEVARADNLQLAQAALSIVQALQIAYDQGWVDSETAIQLAFKFAGETLTPDQIKKILQGDVPPGDTL
ncbi:MAG TPA: hypothetical protein VMX14_13465 [Anaerolineae bacterium]|nr:hypothetical protein [Anaerolineae bacterium]